MTDRYAHIRDALTMGPTPGPWGFTELPRDMQRDGFKFAISRRGIGWRFAQIAHEMKSMANATYITACDPDTIRELLDERDALQAECDALSSNTRLSLGVGDGDGNLFVHGDYDSIKRVQALIFENERLLKDVEALSDALQGLLNIVSDSSGVAGYHLNGNIADWDEFEEVENAEVALSTYRKQGGEE